MNKLICRFLYNVPAPCLCFGFIFAFFCQTRGVSAQIILYQDIYSGGVTGAAFSTSLGFGSGSFDIHVPSASIIRKAYLIGHRYGMANDATITLNGMGYNFNTSNQVSGNFYIPNSPTANLCAVHCIEITNSIDSSITNYSINIPNQPNTFPYDKYGDFYLLILYENLGLPSVNLTLIVNNQDLISNNIYDVGSLNPVDTTYPIGLSINCDIINHVWLNDGSYVYFNDNLIGLIGGSSGVDSAWSYGVRGHFYYENNTLYGLDDDTPDSIFNGSDGLANISYLMDNNDTSFNLSFKWEDSLSVTSKYNIYTSFHLAYTTPCDTFSAGISSDTLMDLGDVAHLSAYGGIKYKWQPSTGLSCDTCSNPFASPDSSTLYTCTIYNNDSCTKVLPVKVNIYNNISVEPVQNNIVVSLYPNPTHNDIVISHSYTEEIEFTISNTQGQELKKGIIGIGETKLDLQDISPGFYFVILKHNDFSRSMKFVKGN